MGNLRMLALMLLLLPAIAMAEGELKNNPISPFDVVASQTNLLLVIAVMLMIVMVVLAASVYVGAQFFGAETRAKATIWSQGMLIAVGISVAVLIILYSIMPEFITGTGPVYNVPEMIVVLMKIGQTTLILMVVAAIVISGLMYAIGQMFGAETRARATTYSTMLLGAAIFAAVVYVVLYDFLVPMSTEFFAGTILGIYGDVIVEITFMVACFILITYLLSKFFKVPEWEAYLNVEMSNLMSSFLIVLFVLGLFAASSVISLLMTGGSASSPPQAAIVYMQGTVADSALTAAMDVYKINACTSMLSTFSRRIGEYVLTQTYKVFPGLDTFVSITNVLGFTLLSLYNTAAVQIGLLYFIDATMIPFFMPAGLMLRFFPPTRDAGAFLISLAFGLQIIFPTSYLINKQIFDDVNSDAPQSKPYRSPTILIQSLCGPFKYGLWGYLLNPTASPLVGLFPGSGAIVGFLSKLVSESLLNAVSMAEFIPIMKHVAALSLVTLFMPALAMMVTIAFINAMTKFIVAKV